MASIRQLKTRIRSVNSTKQITGAMQLVSASKMRRAIDQDSATAEYAAAARELLAHLAREGAADKHPLFAKRPVKKRLLVVISSDTGLAGAYNANVLKRYTTELKKDDAAGIKNATLAIGRKISRFSSRLKDTEVLGTYEDLPDRPTGIEIKTILSTIIDQFESGEVDAVDVIFTQFFTTIRQEVTIQRLLPAGFASDTEVSEEIREAIFEPSPRVVLDAVVERMVETQLVQGLLDSTASEHSMRMLAMKNATDNATQLADDLTLAMNKERQAAITQELAEISGGVEALAE